MTHTIPSTWKELEAAGYTYENRTLCKRCGRQIEWWRTPSGRWMSIEAVPEAGGARMAHWGVCPKADEFRRQSVKADVKQEVKASPKQKQEVTQRKLFR